MGAKIFGPDGKIIKSVEPAPEPVKKKSGTLIKDEAVGERMLAGAKAQRLAMPKIQRQLRAQGVRLSTNKLKGAIRRSRRQDRRKKFKGSEGFVGSLRLARTSSGPSEKAAARQRAQEFNLKHLGEAKHERAADTVTEA